MRRITALMLLLWSATLVADHFVISPRVPLRNGDIVLRHGTGVWSERIRLANRRDTRYSHAGVIVMKSGVPYVIHADMDDTTMAGSVVEIPLAQFLKESKADAVYRYASATPAQADAIAAEAKRHMGKPFDRDFDLTTDSRLYCTELVWLSVNKALRAEVIKPGVLGGRAVVRPEDCLSAPGFVRIESASP